MLININRKKAVPLYQQIINAVKRHIREGTLESGQTLPSSRKLAEMLGANRTTVNRAYEELQALGYLSSRPGSYHRIQERRREAAYQPDRKSPIPWNDAVTEPARQIHDIFLRYSPEQPKTDRIPYVVLKRCVSPDDEFPRAADPHA